LRKTPALVKPADNIMISRTCRASLGSAAAKRFTPNEVNVSVANNPDFFNAERIPWNQQRLFCSLSIHSLLLHNIFTIFAWFLITFNLRETLVVPEYANFFLLFFFSFSLRLWHLLKHSPDHSLKLSSIFVCRNPKEKNLRVIYRLWKFQNNRKKSKTSTRP
jgi:hypothetical protein